MSQPHSYAKKFATLLSGSLNLLPPGDAIGELDALILENWRPQQDGSLVSRRGNFHLNIATDGVVNSIYKVDVVRPTYWLGDSLGKLYGIGGHPLVITGFGGVGDPGIDNPSLWPISMTSMDGNLYAVTQQKQVRIGSIATGGAGGALGASNYVPATPTGGSVSPVGGGSFLAGDVVTYYVTFITADSESDGKKFTITPGAGNSAQFTLPTSTDPLVTGVNVYRQNGALNQPYLVGSNLTLGAVFLDTDSLTQSDSKIEAADVPYEPDHQGPPPAALIAGPYMGHLLMANSAAHPSRFWWSKATNANYWPGATPSGMDLVDGNWADVGDDLDPVVAISLFPQMAVFYRMNSIYRLVGDPDDTYSVVEPLMQGFGIVGPKAITKAGRIDYFGAADGVYRLNGESLDKASHKVQKVFDGDWHEIGGVLPPMPVPPMRYAMALGHRNGRIFCSYNDGTAS